MRYAILSLALLSLLRCGGAFQEIREGRNVAFYDDPDQGRRHLILVSSEALERDRTNGTNLLNVAKPEELTAAESEWAMKSAILGGRCYITGAVIPPLSNDLAQRIWGWEVSMEYASILTATPELDYRARLGVAASRVTDRYPVLASFEDPKFLDLVVQEEEARQAQEKAERDQAKANGAWTDEEE